MRPSLFGPHSPRPRQIALRWPRRSGPSNYRQAQRARRVCHQLACQSVGPAAAIERLDATIATPAPRVRVVLRRRAAGRVARRVAGPAYHLETMQPCRNRSCRPAGPFSLTVLGDPGSCRAQACPTRAHASFAGRERNGIVSKVVLDVDAVLLGISPWLPFIAGLVAGRVEKGFIVEARSDTARPGVTRRMRDEGI